MLLEKNMIPSNPR